MTSVLSPFSPFIIQINSGADSKYTIPTRPLAFTYNYSVKTSDGQNFSGVTGNLTINFPSANTNYDIEITGIFPHFYIAGVGEYAKLLDRKQNGDVVFSSLQGAYYGASNALYTATDIIKVSGLTNATNAFRSNSAMVSHPLYDDSLLTDANNMYQSCVNFNPSSFPYEFKEVTTAINMHLNNTKFNPIDYAPKFKNLVNGQSMLQNCTSFTHDIMFDDPINGTVNLQNANTMFYLIKSKKIWMQAGALTTVNINSFQCPLLEDFRLIGMSVSFTIQYSPNLVGSKIDDLVASLKDMTGHASPTLTVSTAQSLSGIDTAAIAAKNWTLAVV